MKILFTIPTEDGVRERFQSITPHAEFVFADSSALSESDIESADILIGNVPPKMLHAPAGLRFFQTYTAGANVYTVPGVLAPETVLCNASGAYGVALAEHMLAQLLMVIKKLGIYLGAQKEHSWIDAGPVRGIIGSQTLVVGAGDIGTQFGKRMSALGSRVIGIRRHKAEAPEWMSESGTMEDIGKWIGEADYIACSLPETPETNRMMNSDMFSRMKKDAILLNIGRGTLVDTEALISALRNGDLGAYITDVTDPEPLPPESPLWDCPNVWITPHISGNYHLHDTYERVIAIAERNLKAFLAGEKLLNVVDRETGYRRFEG